MKFKSKRASRVHWAKANFLLQENVRCCIPSRRKGNSLFVSSVSDLSFISLTAPPCASVSLYLLSLITSFLPTKWSYPLHGHVWDVNPHVSSSGPGQKMSCQDRLQGTENFLTFLNTQGLDEMKSQVKSYLYHINLLYLQQKRAIQMIDGGFKATNRLFIKSRVIKPNHLVEF